VSTHTKATDKFTFASVDDRNNPNEESILCLGRWIIPSTKVITDSRLSFLPVSCKRPVVNSQNNTYMAIVRISIGMTDVLRL
jgi:hypothetical protein